jgi:uncharacterized protein YcbX
MARIASLHVYPVKSCRGIDLDTAVLASNGFAHDREWVIVDPQDHFLTQRDEPRLALLQTRLVGGRLELRRPDSAIPLSVAVDHGGTARVATVWRTPSATFDAGDGAATWLSDFLGRPVRLLRFDPTQQRLSNREWTGDIAAPNFFTDGYPVLVLSRASIADLGARVGRELPVDRFRPNLLLDGVEPYAEDAVREIDIGEVTLRLVKPSTRCVITTTDQATGTRDGTEPLRTLKAYRFDRALRGVTFGMNAIIVRGVGASLARGEVVALR